MSNEGESVRCRGDAEYVQLKQLLRGLNLPQELSHREIQIVAAAVRGLDTKATAAELDLDPKTVDEYWRRVYRKLQRRSRLEVLALLNAAARREGEPQLATPPPVAVAARRR
jgi:DNA-binding NarL/FixJ family response regulator